jgi:DNA-binding response OmpR family regulator
MLASFARAERTGHIMRTIFYVEDDDDLREVVCETLEIMVGWCVYAVRSSEHLLEIARSVAPDLIVLDVWLPGMDGIETYRLLRSWEQTATTPVLFLTVGERALLSANPPGVWSYLPKPFSTEALLRRVGVLLGETGTD